MEMLKAENSGAVFGGQLWSCRLKLTHFKNSGAVLGGQLWSCRQRTLVLF